MKRFFLSSIVFLAVLSLASASFAASATVNLTVIVTSGNVTIGNTGPAVLDFATMIVGNSKISPQGTFSNQGDTAADWSIEATAFTNGTDTWTFMTDAPGSVTVVNQVRLAAIWGDWQNQPALADFGVEDVVTNAAKVSSTTDFAKTGDADSFKGFNVQPSSPRDIWFRLDAPAASSAGLTTPMTSIVTVTAAIH